MSTTINISATAQLWIETDAEAGTVRLELDSPHFFAAEFNAHQAETVAQVIAALTGRPSPTTDILRAADTVRAAREEVAR